MSKAFANDSTATFKNAELYRDVVPFIKRIKKIIGSVVSLKICQSLSKFFILEVIICRLNVFLQGIR